MILLPSNEEEDRVTGILFLISLLLFLLGWLKPILNYLDIGWVLTSYAVNTSFLNSGTHLIAADVAAKKISDRMLKRRGRQKLRLL